MIRITAPILVTLTAAQTNYFMYTVHLEWSFFCEFAARSRISANIITNPDSSFELSGGIYFITTTSPSLMS